MTDTNISYIWGFLKTCQERDWLYKGHRSMPWCPRCGTSLSQHELIDSYKEITHPSLFVRFPLVGREHEELVVWTTTPWTLPANVAAAVLPDADYARVQTGAGIAYVAAEPARPRAAQGQGGGHGQGLRAGRAGVRRAVRRPRRAGGRRAPDRRLGRGLDGRGHGHRPHRAGLRRRGLRAGPPRRARDDRAGRRVGRVLRRLRLAARPPHRRRGAADPRGPRASAAGWSMPARSPTAIPSAGAAARS